MLTIAEQLLLLWTDERKGELWEPAYAAVEPALAGAVLAELEFFGKTRVDDQKYILLDPDPFGNRLMDNALAKIMREERPRKLRHWVDKLATKKLRRRVQAELTKKSLLREDENGFIALLPTKEGAEPISLWKYRIKLRLRSVLLAGEDPAPADIVLISLLKACHSFELLLTKDEQPTGHIQSKQIAAGNPYGEAVAQVLKDAKRKK